MKRFIEGENGPKARYSLNDLTIISLKITRSGLSMYSLMSLILDSLVSRVLIHRPTCLPSLGTLEALRVRLPQSSPVQPPP